MLKRFYGYIIRNVSNFICNQIYFPDIPSTNLLQCGITKVELIYFLKGSNRFSLQVELPEKYVKIIIFAKQTEVSAAAWTVYEVYHREDYLKYFIKVWKFKKLSFFMN